MPQNHQRETPNSFKIHDINNDTKGAYGFYILSNIRIKSADSIQPFNSSKENIHRQNKK